MKLVTIIHKDGSVQVQITVETPEGAFLESMTMSEWSKLLATPVVVEEA